jgi:hypothetical protein
VLVAPADGPRADFGAEARPRPPQLGVRAVPDEVEEVAERAHVVRQRRDAVVERRRQGRVDAVEAPEADLHPDRVGRRRRGAHVPDVGGGEDARGVRADADGLPARLGPADGLGPAAQARQEPDGLEELEPVALALHPRQHPRGARRLLVRAAGARGGRQQSGAVGRHG